MVGPTVRQRRTIIGVALAMWLFALFVGIAHACGWVERGPAPAHAAAANSSEHRTDGGTPVGCEQFCKTDLPLVSKLPFIGDQPDGQPLIVGVEKVRIILALPPPFGVAHAAYPSSDVPPFLRFNHLRL